MGFFSKVNPFKGAINKVLDDVYGIDNKTTRSFLNPLEIIQDPGKRFRMLTDPGAEPTLKDPTFDPFAVDNRSVIGASEALRKRLANKRGLSSTDITGGVRSTATGLKPTLFTFN